MVSIRWYLGSLKAALRGADFERLPTNPFDIGNSYDRCGLYHVTPDAVHKMLQVRVGTLCDPAVSGGGMPFQGSSVPICMGLWVFCVTNRSFG